MALRDRDYLEHAKRLKRRYGADYFALIGAIGGTKSKKGGFYANRDLARDAGLKGGNTSKRGKRYIGPDADGNPQYLKEN